MDPHDRGEAVTAADLLRRAATKLRETAHEVPAYFAQPWHSVYTDSESLTGIRVCENHEPPADLTAEQGVNWACDACEYFETYREGLAAYAALMHPPVALALADLLDRAADAIPGLESLANTGRMTEPHLAHLADLLAFRQLARAVLREPEEADRG
jgi:hypothetical protein